jgi:heme exporter protein D
VSRFAYYLVWLAVGLAIIAVISALITRQLRRRVMRRLKAVEMLDALMRYSEWVASQRTTLLFNGALQEGASGLGEVCALGRRWFPDLSAQLAQICTVHARLIEFLAGQQALRQQDPETWLESDPEARFLEHWRQHVGPVQQVLAKLRLTAEGAEAGPQGTIFPA